MGEARASGQVPKVEVPKAPEETDGLAGAICPSLPALPVSPLGLNLLPAPLEAED